MTKRSFEDSEKDSPISLAEVAEGVKKLLCGEALCVDVIRPEMPKALLGCHG